MVDFEKLAHELAQSQTHRRSKFHSAARAVADEVDAGNLPYSEAESTIRLMVSIIDPGSEIPVFGWFKSSMRLMYQTERQLLVLHDKHDTRYIGIDGPDQFATAMLGVLDDRNKEAYYGDGTTEPDFLYSQSFTKAEGFILEAYKKPDALVGVTQDLPEGTPGRFGRMIRAILHSDDMKEMTSSLSAEFRWVHLLEEIKAGSPNELLTAFLALSFPDDTMFSDARRRHLLPLIDNHPLLKAIYSTSATSAYEDASEILEMARKGSFRRAGRLAYEFLEERSSHEYERIQLVDLEVPSFDRRLPSVDGRTRRTRTVTSSGNAAHALVNNQSKPHAVARAIVAALIKRARRSRRRVIQLISVPSEERSASHEALLHQITAQWAAEEKAAEVARHTLYAET